MESDLHRQVIARLQRDYRLVDRGEWLRQGTCPDCKDKKSLFANAASPWAIICGRASCGCRKHVKELYPDLFENWSERFKADEANPTAAADAYLQFARGLNITKLGRCYTQESYFDSAQRIGSATVRFTLPNGTTWERLIDRPQRFERKAHFQRGAKANGEWWQSPKLTLDVLARLPEIWIPEGIFCAASLTERGLPAVAAMSCNFYPADAMLRVADYCANHNIPRPRIVFAFDGNKAGRVSMVKAVHRAIKDGWVASAALTTADLVRKPVDWNDLHLLDSKESPTFSPERIEEYRWNGAVLMAGSAMEKAKLLHKRKGWSNFILDHANRTYRARVNESRVAELVTQMTADPMTASWSHAAKREVAVDDAMAVNDIANFKLTALYFQKDLIADEGSYYLLFELPDSYKQIKAELTAAEISASSDFYKRLKGINPALTWEGEQSDLVKITKPWGDITEVTTTYVTGYVREYSSYVFPEHAVTDGKIISINDQDYFDIGKLSVKSTHKSNDDTRQIIKWDGSEYRCEWLADWYEAFGERGIIALTFWFGTLFAEQIRARLESWPFLEFWGEPNGGKSTCLKLLWRMLGRRDYEGFDPTKASLAGRSRNFGRVGNLPVVLIESERNGDDPRQHVKQFDWEELKTAYNGGALSTRGVANGGMETFEPPFRGAIVISQNASVQGSQAIMERIVSQEFAKRHHTPSSREAVDRLLARDPDSLSGFILHAVRQEAPVLVSLFAAFKVRERQLIDAKKARNTRVIKTHSQMLAALDAMAPVVGMPAWMHEKAAAHILTLSAERDARLAANHPSVDRFWELVNFLIETENATPATGGFLDHSRSPDVIAIRLIEFEQRCAHRKLEMPPLVELKKYLKASKHPKFIDNKPVNSRNTGTAVHCWVFQRTPSGKD